MSRRGEDDGAPAADPGGRSLLQSNQPADQLPATGRPSLELARGRMCHDVIFIIVLFDSLCMIVYLHDGSAKDGPYGIGCS